MIRLISPIRLILVHNSNRKFWLALNANAAPHCGGGVADAVL
jgi:hypothetical protein